MKIKYLIDTILTPQITALEFADKYAGIVKTINIAVDNQSDTGTIKRYPVAFNVQGDDCAKIGVYGELVPDDTKKSVIYWELIQPMTNAGYTKTRDFFNKRFKGTARLIVWLNLAKLGIDDCNGAILTLPILEKILTQKGKLLTGVYEKSLLWIEPKNLVKQDINTIFGNYDYPKLKNYYLYPYDFFAIDVNFTLEQCLSKGGVWPCILPLDCPNSGPAICKSLNLDGVNEYIDCGNNAAFNQDFNTPFTVSAWVKIISLDAILETIFSKISFTTGTGWALRVTSQKIRLILSQAFGGSNQINVVGTTLLNVGEWYQVAATFDGTNNFNGIKLYINGTEEITAGGGGPLVSFQNAENLHLGGQSSIFSNLNIASARMWKTELSAAEILEEYNSGKIKSIPVQNDNTILNIALNCATWDGTKYNIPDDSQTAAAVVSVNSEENDLLTDCP